MRKSLFCVVGVVGSFFFGAAALGQTLTTASLVQKPELVEKLLQLHQVVICTNDESNDMALADAGDLVKQETMVTTTGVTLSDGTACAWVDRKDLAALLTGRGVSIGGSSGPVIAEIYSRSMGYAYAIIPVGSEAKVIAQR
jgi:hypothetical protein